LAKDKSYHLPENNYSGAFIRYLAMADHLKIFEPEELTFMLESGKTLNEIALTLKTRIQKKYN